MALADKAGISFSLIIAARALLPLYLRLDNTKNSSRHCDFARNTPIKSFPVLSADIRIWVTVWVSAISAKMG